MKKLTPELVLSMKHYSKEDFVKDLVSGVIVAIIALPLSIALALPPRTGSSLPRPFWTMALQTTPW